MKRASIVGGAILAILAAAPGYSPPRVTKVEPPNWWVGHTRNPIQVLLTGTDLK